MTLGLWVTLIPNCGYAQFEAAIWYFGRNAGLDFRSGAPVPLLDGQLNTLEGCSAISDPAGNLLFYSDGTTVWNRNHDVMQAGTDLKGHPSSTNSGIIVPGPGNNGLFYLFSAGALEGNTLGIHYSIIDINEDDGLGAVTSKNIPLIIPAAEKLSAVRHSNKTDIWVVAHGIDDGFYAYLVSAMGVADPVVSRVGFDIGPFPRSSGVSAGDFKFSPDGTKASIVHSQYLAELLDFDAATGQFSNPKKLVDNIKIDPNNGNEFLYGTEFSPSGRYLYVGHYRGRIYQFDTELDTPVPLEIHTPDQFLNLGAMQLGIDGKIYIVQRWQPAIHVINTPEAAGTASDLQFGVVDLGGRESAIGLPPFIQSFFIVGDIEVSNLCFGDTTTFSIDVPDSYTTIEWDFGDGTTTTGENPTHVYADPGTYTVSVTVTAASGATIERRPVTILEQPIANAPANITVCATSGGYPLDLSTLDSEILGTQSMTDFSVAYFSTASDAELGVNPLSPQATFPIGINTVHARVSNRRNGLCYVTTNLEVIVSLIPELTVVSDWYRCDNDSPQIFDLQEKATAMLSGRTDIQLSFHHTAADADLRQNAIEESTVIVGHPETLYFRLENANNSHCFASGSFGIGVFAIPLVNTPQDWVVCAQDEAGNYTFELAQMDTEVLGVQDEDPLEVSYHSSEQEAIDGVQPLSKSEYQSSGTTVLYARVQQSQYTVCYDITSFALQVNPWPVPSLETSYVICPDSPELILDAGDFETYSWQDASGLVRANTRLWAVPELGSFTLTVTELTDGVVCENTVPFEVLSSGAPESLTVTTEGSADRIILNIEATGIGDFEYAIDGSPFQDTPRFEVFPGIYRVYVRDVLGCRELAQEVVAMGYQKFFTPNGDGQHEHWNIIGGARFPSSRVYIFDRYGRLLKQLTPTSLGWDGTYAGGPMPAADYWFRYEYGAGEVMTGHFVLKR